MSTTVELPEPQDALAQPAVQPLNEAVWQAWVAKGHAEDRHARATFVKGVKCVTIAGLLTAAGFGSNLGPFDVVIRFIVAAGALVVMFQALQARHYPFAPLFGTLALLYNPVAPVFSFSGGWQQALVVLTAVPFVASLVWRKARKAQHDYRSDVGSYRGPVSG